MRKKTKKIRNYNRKSKIHKKPKVKKNKSNKSRKVNKSIAKNSTSYRANCSPKHKNELNNYTCYTDKSLFKLKELWNKRHPDVILKTNNPKEIHNYLYHVLGDVCRNESCWLKQKFHFGDINNELINDFAPQKPLSWKKNPNEWLSSVDIMNVMDQYEKAYKCFEFFGPSPIDFDKRKLYGECVWNEICNFNLGNQIKQGKKKFGFIFNTDPHFKDGEHWISLFIDVNKKEIIFFDSTGDKIPSEIQILVDRIINQGLQLKPAIHFKYDHTQGKQHQVGNTECGVYCLYFIINMLRDKTNVNDLKSKRLPDHYIKHFRHKYFN